MGLLPVPQGGGAKTASDAGLAVQSWEGPEPIRCFREEAALFNAHAESHARARASLALEDALEVQERRAAAGGAQNGSNRLCIESAGPCRDPWQCATTSRRTISPRSITHRGTPDRRAVRSGAPPCLSSTTATVRRQLDLRRRAEPGEHPRSAMPRDGTSVEVVQRIGSRRRKVCGIDQGARRFIAALATASRRRRQSDRPGRFRMKVFCYRYYLGSATARGRVLRRGRGGTRGGPRMRGAGQLAETGSDMARCG